MIEEKDRKIIVTITPTGAVSVLMTGGHLTKRELERALKAVKQKRNRKIREYNTERRIAMAEVNTEAEAKLEKEKENGERK